MRCSRRSSLRLASLLFVLTSVLPCGGQANVTMRHNDPGQTGANLAETRLNHISVSTDFGKLFSVPIKGDMYAQILVVSNVNIHGGIHNVAYAATGHDVVYAFDADNGTVYWTQTLGTTVPQCVIGSEDIPNEVGIVGTPVIDVGLGAMYVVTKTFENVTVQTPCSTGTQVLRLHALDIGSGAEILNGPIEITGSVSGMGSGNMSGTITFDPSLQNQRPGLTLANGNVYIGFASHGDQGNYHGWVLAYTANPLKPSLASPNPLPTAIFNSSKDSGEGAAGIWMSGQAPVVIDNLTGGQDIYVVTGNGLNNGNGVFRNSFIRLSHSTLQEVDYFRPNESPDPDSCDCDLGAGGLLAIPGTNFIVGGGKQNASIPGSPPNPSELFLVNINSMGGYTSNFTSIVADGGNIFSSPVWWNNNMYLWGTFTTLKSWAWTPSPGNPNAGSFSSSPSLPTESSPPKTPQGYSANAGLSISANGNDPQTAIVWALKPTTDPNKPVGPGVLPELAYGSLAVLYAFDAITLNTLYSSDQRAADAVGFYAKYDLPTIANGKVYVPTRNWDGTGNTQIPVYGLFPKRRAVRPLSEPAPITNQNYSFFPVDPADQTVETPDHFDLSGDLPPGMTFTFASGQLSGSPSYPGVYDFTATANYVDGMKIPQEYALSICQTGTGPNISAVIPFNTSYVIGTIHNNSSGVYSFDLVSGSLPPGMVLDKTTGMVSGAPSVAGTYYPRIRTTRLLDPNVSSVACPANTTSDLFYQLTVTCTTGQCQFEGYNDGLDANNVWGWAWDKSQPNSPIEVDIYDSPYTVVPAGTPLIARVTANLFRQDLLDAGKGNGYHAFTYPIPGNLQDGQTHSIHVTYAGTLQDLGWSPRSFASARFVGTHSNNDCDHIDGFALDNWQPNVPIDVQITDNGQFLATLVANYDSTIVPATSGHGTHGFLYYTPSRLKDGSAHLITITFKLSGGTLASTSRSLSCPVVPASSSPSWEGWFDNVTCERVDGWGWDANLPNTPIDMRIMADGVPAAILTANYFSQDLLNAGKGNGAHRFLYYFPDFLKDGLTHYITAQIVGQNTNLPISSSITNGYITCAAIPTPTGPPPGPISNTQPGSGVLVSGGQPVGISPGVSATFSSVSAAGFTSFVALDPANLGLLPDGYAFPHAPVSPLAFEISTTAGYTGPVSVTFTIPSVTDSAEFSALRVLHNENGVWMDRTVLPPDFSSHRLTAQVSSFSPFVIARLIQGPFASTVALNANGNSTYGQNVVFTATVSATGATPTGTITFTEGAQWLGSASLNGSGQASFSTSLLTTGPHLIYASYSGDSVYPRGSAWFNQIVSLAPLSVVASSTSRAYGAANSGLTGAVTGLANNDNIGVSYYSTASSTSPVGKTYPIISVLSDPSGRLNNYSVSQVQGTLTISPAPLLIAANDKTRLYGDANPVFDGVISGVVNNDGITASFNSAAGPASTIGTYPITPSVSDPNGRLVNYSLSMFSGTLTVQPAPLQVTATNKTRAYGTPNPILDGTITGIRNGDNIQAQYSTTATTQSPPGTYPITPSLSDPNSRLGNYSVGITNGTLTVTDCTPPAPTGLIATAISNTQVNISWAAPSATFDHYELDRKQSISASFVKIANIANNTTSYTDLSVASTVGYLYQVRAVCSSGSSSPGSNMDLATTMSFTDSPLTVGVTAIKAQHFNELRAAVNAVRATAGLAQANWTDPSLPGVVVKAVHITELRQNLNQALQAMGFSIPSYTDSTLNSGFVVKAVHVEEIRQAVR